MNRPYTLIAELTHRCPLSCAYCSNPRDGGAGAELPAEIWLRVLGEAALLGVIQVHFTGGEPVGYERLPELVSRATELELSSQLVTSAVGLSRDKLASLTARGLGSVQISLHELPGRPWPTSFSVEAARSARELGLPLTLNLVLHRQNLERIPAAIALAEELGADRLELANVQYLGWAFANRDALLPGREELQRARELAREARDRLRGKLDLVSVLPDLFAGRPRACMSGLGRRFVVVAPDGTALPCHAAKVLGLPLENVRERELAWIWHESDAFATFRGEEWMEEPCRSCELRGADFGGCRCQAKLWTGDARATDPACRLSPHHERVLAVVEGPERPIALLRRSLLG